MALSESDAGSNTQTQPACHTVLTTKLTDENNLEQLKLPFQHKVVDVYHEQQVQDAAFKNSKDHRVSDTTESEAIGRNSSAVSLNENQVKKACMSLKNLTAIDDDGFLTDINIQLITEEIKLCEDKKCDIDQFFYQPVMKNVNGKEKKYCICKVCFNEKAIVNEVTMLLEAHHSRKYQKWAQENSLNSKLPGDIKKHKVDAEHVT
ncbi:hypothetical protein C0995_004885 [Termitomyces sp. Mi166|nr:hypothetical protein C0995_004885 [Termitomyces sp. Mi166\